MSAIPENKVLLQELNQLIGIKLLTSDFREICGSWSQVPGRGNARFAPRGRSPSHSPLNAWNASLYVWMVDHLCAIACA